MKLLYKQNYCVKLLLLIGFSILLSQVSKKIGYDIIPMPVYKVDEYHTSILTINSIFSGFALTNLGILLSVSDDQLIKKLEGTDILQKRNIVIGHSIFFGAISTLISVFGALGINLSFLNNIFGEECLALAGKTIFYVEIFSLLISILYFILSIKKMMQLLALIHVPKRRYSEEQIEEMKRQIYGNRKKV